MISNNDYENEGVKNFLSQLDGENSVQSTSAEIITASQPDYPVNLFNVDGSTCDPIPNHQTSWSALLIHHGIGVGGNCACYVSNPLPNKKKSHPNFDVGGHMTTFQDGSVDIGGICYLMPLCKWHNNKKRDGIMFYHFGLDILKLSGYLKNELSLTFMMRMKAEKEKVILFLNSTGWEYKYFTDDNEVSVLKSAAHTPSDILLNSHYIFHFKNGRYHLMVNP